MALVGKEPPAEVRKVIDSALRQFQGVPAERMNALRGIDIGALRPTNPLETFNVGLADLKAGRIGQAQKTGWRYLLQENDSVVAIADAVTDAAGGSPRFAQFNRGPFVTSTAGVLEKSRDLVDQSKDYAPRILNIPALYAVIVWFRHEGGGDVYVPLAPAPAGLEPGRSYSEAEIMPILRERAQAIPDLAPDDTRGG